MKCFKHVRYSIRIVAMLLLVATFSSIHGFPVFAIETENISDELMELKRATDPNTPIDNVFIELAIDETDYMMAKTKEGITE